MGTETACSICLCSVLITHQPQRLLLSLPFPNCLTVSLPGPSPGINGPASQARPLHSVPITRDRESDISPLSPSTTQFSISGALWISTDENFGVKTGKLFFIQKAKSGKKKKKKKKQASGDTAAGTYEPVLVKLGEDSVISIGRRCLSPKMQMTQGQK